MLVEVVPALTPWSFSNCNSSSSLKIFAPNASPKSRFPDELTEGRGLMNCLSVINQTGSGGVSGMDRPFSLLVTAMMRADKSAPTAFLPLVHTPERRACPGCLVAPYRRTTTRAHPASALPPLSLRALEGRFVRLVFLVFGAGGLAQPEGDVCWLHGFLDDVEQVLA